MKPVKSLLIAAPVMLGLLASPAAHAEWRGGYHHGWAHPEVRWGHPVGGNGLIAGTIIGLGIGALAGGMIAAQPVYHAPAQVVYAPRPAYYAEPVYPAPVYAAPAYAAPVYPR